MKLVHPDFEYQFILHNQRVCEWVIESPRLLAKYVKELICQAEGGEGEFVLSEEGKEFNFSKYVEIIVNPFSINVNDKKILNKLYGELSELANREDMFLATQETLARIQNYFFELEQISSYVLESDLEIDTASLFKAIGVRVESNSMDFFENMIQYMKLLAELLGKKVIVLVNIRSYLTDLQLEELVRASIYNEVALLLIESRQWDFSNTMNRYIIDNDSCEIF